MKKEQKYYVVWKGRTTGVFDTWADCKKQTDGFQGAVYKSFKTKALAELAFQEDSQKHLISKTKQTNESVKKTKDTSAKPILESISVDAACSGNPGVMEYRGVETNTGKEIFRMYYAQGTNNIGEFLAIVHALALFEKDQKPLKYLYSDSKIAIGWIKLKKCKTNLKPSPKNERLFEHIRRAETWLEEHTFDSKILKWQTDIWGEIPADFGRK